jgi:DNA polymerase delta subunit 1
LEGDQVTFIGSTFVNYGEELPRLQHCICVNKSETIVPSHTLECYSTEKEAILAWSELIRKEDPDIIIGYNIFGFDYKFMFERATELDCVEKFMDLGRNLEYCVEPEESKIVLASGPYDLTRLHMCGRLQIDMYTYMRKEFNLTSYKLVLKTDQKPVRLLQKIQRVLNLGHMCILKLLIIHVIYMMTEKNLRLSKF